MQFKYISTTCPGCGTGCGLNQIVTDEGVAGVAPYHRSAVNRGKLCTRGLSVAKYLKQTPRVEKPLVDGKEATLDAAIAEVKKISGADVFISPRITTEAIYAFARYAKEVQKTDAKVFQDVSVAGNATLGDIAGADVILFVGDCMHKLPVTGGNALRAKDNGAKLLYAGKLGVYTAVQADEVAELKDSFDLPAAFADALKGAKAGVVATTAGNKFAKDAEAFAKANGAKFAVLYGTNNGRGAQALGCKAARSEVIANGFGKNVIAIVDAPANVEEFYEKSAPFFDKIENLILITTAATPLIEKAKVVIPMACFTEYDGSFVNWEGKVQTVNAAVPAVEGYPTPYEIAAKLSDGKIAYENAAAIFAEITAKVPAFKDAKLAVDGSYIKEA